MKFICLPFACVLVLGGAAHHGHAHLIGETAHDHGAPQYDFSVAPPQTQGNSPRTHEEVRRFIRLAAAASRETRVTAASVAEAAGSGPAARVAAAFAPFAPKVKTRADANFLFVESDGLPAHNMMVGITAWQQQVPLPHDYSGHNAWRLPLRPVPAKNPVSIKNRFLRGAIALAANGIPIFNPQNNRGEISQEIGELDQWGGHCGRADDYHYHAAPFHLQSVLGKNLPIAYALDGYPIYGLTEPDGSAPTQLDRFNGHDVAGLGYHYHGSTKYPYVNGGFHGEVVERDGQVDPQPAAGGWRGAGTPLRGARITGFQSRENQSFSLQYEIGGETRAINYAVTDTKTARFEYVDGRGQVTTETYTQQPRGGGGGPGAPNGRGGPQRGPGRGGPPPPPPPPPPPVRGETPPPRDANGAVAADSYTPKRSGTFLLRSSAVTNGGALPVEFTGDGAGISPPLEWSGAPAGTKSFAIIMDHLDPEGRAKWYWVLYNIPANVGSLPKDSHGVGTLGNNSVNRRPGYAPPHSKGPGVKAYLLTAFALAAPVPISTPSAEVNRDLLLAAMKDLILDSAQLKVTHDRTSLLGGPGENPRPSGPGGPRRGPAN
ncbi:hypothetical protein LBMAG56_11250 [Verrucomicrobiota bacterium]|nr:hypothetical protein LBMAG56_11250 [Verrucomicrobiota bacterium]